MKERTGIIPTMITSAKAGNYTRVIGITTIVDRVPITNREAAPEGFHGAARGCRAFAGKSLLLTALIETFRSFREGRTNHREAAAVRD
jgi:hypothetical protein